ncbi:hypothetical protein SBBP1_1380002 [Burkholderiales bacterium]|nr:hypothetical protein SBBP1_1380002 [Burkholderiales bacterium]
MLPDESANTLYAPGWNGSRTLGRRSRMFWHGTGLDTGLDLGLDPTNAPSQTIDIYG